MWKGCAKLYRATSIISLFSKTRYKMIFCSVSQSYGHWMTRQPNEACKYTRKWVNSRHLWRGAVCWETLFPGPSASAWSQITGSPMRPKELGATLPKVFSTNQQMLPWSETLILAGPLAMMTPFNMIHVFWFWTYSIRNLWQDYTKSTQATSKRFSVFKVLISNFAFGVFWRHIW